VAGDPAARLGSGRKPPGTVYSESGRSDNEKRCSTHLAISRHGRDRPSACCIDGSIRAHSASLSSAERVAHPDLRGHERRLGRHALVVACWPEQVLPSSSVHSMAAPLGCVARRRRAASSSVLQLPPVHATTDRIAVITVCTRHFVLRIHGSMWSTQGERLSSTTTVTAAAVGRYRAAWYPVKRPAFIGLRRIPAPQGFHGHNRLVNITGW
jgi:hypothetical protein